MYHNYSDYLFYIFCAFHVQQYNIYSFFTDLICASVSFFLHNISTIYFMRNKIYRK